MMIVGSCGGNIVVKSNMDKSIYWTLEDCPPHQLDPNRYLTKHLKQSQALTIVQKPASILLQNHLTCKKQCLRFTALPLSQPVLRAGMSPYSSNMSSFAANPPRA